jgi:hypothetical protein
MKFKTVHKNSNQYYSLGIDEETGIYVLSVVVGRVCLETAYFRLTPEEFHDYPNNKAFIEDLVKSCERGIDDENRDRFIMV